MSRRAFTLVEILIVVVVLAILAAAVIPQFSVATDDSREATAAIIARSIQRQITIKYAQTGSYPTTIDASWFEGGALPTNPFDPDATTVFEIVDASAANLHPGTKTINEAGAFWYNKNNGIIRARVTAGANDAATIARYNAVNACKVTSLSQTN